MRVPLSWLREYVTVAEGERAEDILATLVPLGLEEEAVHRPSETLSGPIVVGLVERCEREQHKNGKTVSWCQVRVSPQGAVPFEGEGLSPDGVQGIVCAAPNIAAGQKVLVALPGCVLPGNFVISARKTYGHLSAGMVASARELGLGHDHDGILVLGDLGLDPQVGTPMTALPGLGFDDEAFEVNVTPDRGYQLSIRGIAREYAAATGQAFTDPATLVCAPTADGKGYPVTIDDSAPLRGRMGASRFVTRVVRGLDPAAPTPSWMAARLRLAGIRTVCLPVDVSNYVMWELGQPLHMYDLDKVTGPLTVRRAVAAERLTTLDGKDRCLYPEDLVIADDSGPIALAGVMGGDATEVADTTVNVLIEAAHFDPVSVARSRRRHKVPSEAAKRFERGVDWSLPALAAQRALDLLVRYASGSAEPHVTDVNSPPSAVHIEVNAAQVARLLGYTPSVDEIDNALQAIGAVTEHRGDSVRVQAPSWRPDLSAVEDVVEEIGRVLGYERIPLELPSPPAGAGLSRAQRSRRHIRHLLAAHGLTEVRTYPFATQEANEVFGSRKSEQMLALALANPLNENARFLRLSLLPALLEVAARNLSRGRAQVALFECASVFFPSSTLAVSLPPAGERPGSEQLRHLEESLPLQPQYLAGVLAGPVADPAPAHTPRIWDYADALDVIRAVGEALGLEVSVQQGQHTAFHPGRTADFFLMDGTWVGRAGQLHPRVASQWRLPEGAAAFECDVDALIAHAPATVTAGVISAFPVAKQDLAVVLPEQVPAGQVRACAIQAAGPLVESVVLFDEYRGASLPAGQKSLTFSLTFRAPDRTLTAEDVTPVRVRVLEALEREFGAKLRS